MKSAREVAHDSLPADHCRAGQSGVRLFHSFTCDIATAAIEARDAEPRQVAFDMVMMSRKTLDALKAAAQPQPRDAGAGESTASADDVAKRLARGAAQPPAVKRADVVTDDEDCAECEEGEFRCLVCDEGDFCHAHAGEHVCPPAIQQALAARDEMFARWLRNVMGRGYLALSIEDRSWLADLAALDSQPATPAQETPGDKETT